MSERPRQYIAIVQDARGYPPSGVLHPKSLAQPVLHTVVKVADYELVEAERDRYREEMVKLRAWCVEQQGYCRPPHLADAPDEVVNEQRGPCAAYGHVVYGLVVHKLDAALVADPASTSESSS
jgi:hypothetical protein